MTSAFEAAERLHYDLGERLSMDRRALATLAQELGFVDDRADTTLDFLEWLHAQWREGLLADRAAKELSERTRTLQETCERMLRIWQDG